MANQNLFYKESGRIGISGIIAMTLVGIIVSLILGFIYGFAIFYIPIIYFNFFITLFFGKAIGYAIGKTAYITKVRNTKAVMLWGLIFGIIGLYFGWVFWINAASEQVLLTFDPRIIFGVMSDIAETGGWSIFNWTPKGGMLYLIWIIEALVIIIMAIISSDTSKGDTPYCENCQKWVERKIKSARLEPISNIEEFKTALINKNFDKLTELKNIEEHIETRTRLQLYACKRCNSTFYLSIDQVNLKVDKDGDIEEEFIEIIHNMIIDKDTFEELDNWEIEEDQVPDDESEQKEEKL